MLSGENGILKQAADSKVQTEKAQEKEEIAITDMEVISDFKISRKDTYKFKNGYLTGIIVKKDEVDSIKKTETVESVENKLPDEYSIYNIDGSDITTKDTTNTATGMIIKKGNIIFGRVIVFGDINCDGKITTTDASSIMKAYDTKESFENAKFKDYEIVSMDVDNNKKINSEDKSLIMDAVGEINELLQDYYAYSHDELEIEFIEDLINEAIASISKEFKTQYNLHYDDSEDYECYIINVNSGTTAGEILTGLGDKYSIKMKIINEEGKRKTITDKTSTETFTGEATIEIMINSGYTLNIYAIVS